MTTEATEEIFAELPTPVREDDERDGFPLRTWLSGMGDQLDEIRDLVERVDFTTPDEGGAVGDGSDLVDPAAADAAWLPWLAQLVGVDFGGVATEQAKRDAIAGAVSGFKGGTKKAMAAAAASVLTGDRRVWVFDHTILNPGDGGEWDVLIVTATTETPGGGASVLDAVHAAGAKPAGVVLRHRDFASTWAELHADRPTIGAWNTTWTSIHETGL